MTDLPAYPGTPRWLKVLAIIGLVAVLVFVTLHLAGGGMGPGMHGTSGDRPPVSVTGGHTPPIGHGGQ